MSLAALVVLALVDPGAVRLEWRAPAGCPTADVVSSQIAAHLAGTPPPELPVEAAAQVVRRGRGFVLELRTLARGRPGARTLRARDCDSLARAAALVIALAVDPSVGARDDPPATTATTPSASSPRGSSLATTSTTPAPSATTVPATSPPSLATTPAPSATTVPSPPSLATSTPPAPSATTVPSPPSLATTSTTPRPATPTSTTPAPATTAGPARSPPSASSPAPIATAEPAAPRRSRRERFALRLLGGVEVGALPGAGALVGVALAHVWPRARLEAFGVYLPPRREAVPYADAEGVARFQLGAAGLRGCGRFARPRLELPLCAGLEAGVLDIVTRGFRPLGTRRAPWVAASAGAALVVRPLRVLGLVLAAELVVPFTRPGTVVGAEPTGEVHRPAAVAGRFAAGIELRFP